MVDDQKSGDENAGSASRFLGTLTAGATHELNNVLSIVQESAGLLHDICMMAEAEAWPRRETMVRRLDAIQQQVDRGIGMVKALNRLAHCPDHERCEIDLRAAVETLVVLNRHQADRQQVVLELADEDPALKVTTNPLCLQMALQAALGVCLEMLKDGGRIRLQLENDVGTRAAVVKMAAEKPDQPPTGPDTHATLWQTLIARSNRLGGTVNATDSPAGLSVRLPLNTP